MALAAPLVLRRLTRMATMGFAGRCWVRWQRFASLTLGAGASAPVRAVVRAAYWAGVRDALESLTLAERERLIEVHRMDRNERGDAITAHAAVVNGVRRCRRQLDAIEDVQRAGEPEHRHAGGARRLARLRAELAYLAGEGRPDVCALAGPARTLVPESAMRPSQSTAKEDDDVGIESDARREWYADNEERVNQLRERQQKQLPADDNEIGED